MATEFPRLSSADGESFGKGRSGQAFSLLFKKNKGESNETAVEVMLMFIWGFDGFGQMPNLTRVFDPPKRTLCSQGPFYFSQVDA